MSIKWTTVLLAPMLIIGCKPKVALPPGEYVGDDVRLMDELSNGDVFLRVNGVSYTKNDFLVASSLHDKIRRLYAGDPLEGPNPPAEAATLKSRPRTASEILRRSLIRQFAEKAGVRPTKEEFDEYVSGLLKSMKQGKSTLQELADKFGDAEGKLFLQYVADDAVAQPLRNYFDKEGRLCPIGFYARSRWRLPQMPSNGRCWTWH